MSKAETQFRFLILEWAIVAVVAMIFLIKIGMETRVLVVTSLAFLVPIPGFLVIRCHGKIVEGLKARHSDAWEALGRPKYTMAESKKSREFIRDKRYEALDDPVLYLNCKRLILYKKGARLAAVAFFVVAFWILLSAPSPHQ